MKLSMWIFGEWLSQYKPVLNIQEGGLEIETVRLFSANFTPEDNCLYVGRIKDLFIEGNDNVICTHKNDIIILPTDDIDDIMNQILNAFEYYQGWATKLLEAISSDIRPSELLKTANEIINEPLYLLDSTQYTLALSEGFPRGSVNYLWDQLIDKGSADFSFLKQLDLEYPEHRTNMGLYYFNAPFLNAHSYNYNMFLDNNWIGLCSMIERKDHIIKQSVIDLFNIFCQNMNIWYKSHSQEVSSMMIDSLFRDILKSNDKPDEKFLRYIRIRFGEISDTYYIFALSSTLKQSLLMGHICKEINLSFHNCISIIYQDCLCVLFHCSGKDKDSDFKKLSEFLKNNSYYGGYSLAFTDIEKIGDHFKEALFASKKIRPVSGAMASYSDFALEYALNEIRNKDINNLIHPSVKSLIEYDKRHHTAFAETLRVYLIKERSQSKTAAALNLHRNSLTYRLKRIDELLGTDLNDDNIRFHIMLSFMFLSDIP